MELYGKYIAVPQVIYRHKGTFVFYGSPESINDFGN